MPTLWHCGSYARQRAIYTNTRGIILLARQRATACAERTSGTNETENTITSDAGAQAGWPTGADIGGLPEDSYGTACSGEWA